MDLWSLGVILFELYKGEPPFFTNSIYSLINHIMTHPVQYPKSISSEFHSFLRVRRQGLRVNRSWCNPSCKLACTILTGL